MKEDEKFSNAGDILKNIFGKLIPYDTNKYNGVFSGWEKIAGPEIALHVKPKDVINNTLILETDHPGWIQKVSMNKKKYLKLINENYSNLSIEKIKIQIVSNSVIQSKIVENNSIESVEEENLESKKHIIKTPEDEDFFKLLEKMKKRANS